MPIKKKFEIDGTTIDLGTDGKFRPGSESRLLEKLSERKDGEKVFNRLVKRGAIKISEPKVSKAVDSIDSNANKEDEKKSKDSGQGKADEKNKSADETGKSSDKGTEGSEGQNDDPVYDATGKFEVHHIGGTLFHKADPDGKYLGEIKTKEKAHSWATDQNKTLE